MFDVIPRSQLRWFIVAFGFTVSCALVGCNFSDKLTGPPVSGCQTDRDCDNNGQCETEGGVGVCACDPGYTESDCSECAAGFERNDPRSPCLPIMAMTNNNTTQMCGDGEVLDADGNCIVDGCAAAPCGAGTCEVTGDGTWECTCPDESIGTECPSCEDDCENGTCNEADECVCDQGWTGATCDACAPGFEGDQCDACGPGTFGENCETCATLNEATPWWNPDYQVRQALIVHNEATTPVRSNVVVQHQFNHEMLVTAGADPRGADVRIVAANDTEMNRILGFDSGWNLPDTSVWFPTIADILPNRFQLFYMYARNEMPQPALDDRELVLLRERGWFYGPGAASGVVVPVFSSETLSTGEYSLQVRQKNPMTMQICFYDANDDPSALAEVRFINVATGSLIEFEQFGSPGSAASPIEDCSFEYTMFPSVVRVEVTMNTGIATGGVYLGDELIESGVGTLSRAVSMSRQPTDSAPPSLFACPPEMAP